MSESKNIGIILAVVIVSIVGVSYFLSSSNNIKGEQDEVVAESNPETKQMKNNIVVLKTNLGDIEIELYTDKAPKTVENFLSYVNNGFYSGTVFHRVIDGFMVQGGGFTKDGQQKPTNEPIVLESDNGLKNDRGMVAMARTNVPDSATSQFFINVVDNDFLNYTAGNPGYAVFGKVINGMDVVDKIKSAETGIKNGMQDWPLEDIIIEDVVVK